jgi:type I restriction enzyme S subunit
MKDSGVAWIGEIPEEWDIIKVKNVYSNSKEVVGNKVDDYERLSLTLNGVLKRSKEDNEGLQPEKFEGYQILRENELVFKLIDLENIRTSRVGLSPYTGLVSPAYITLNNAEHSKFGYYFFSSMWHRNIFNALAGDGVRSNLNLKDLLNLAYPLIPITEQQKIASYLDQKVALIDNIIEKTKQSIEEYKKYKQSLITEIVTKGLNPDVRMKDSGIAWIGEIPEHWEVIKIKHLINIATNKNIYNSNYIGLENIEKGTGRYIDVSEKTTLGGDTLSYEPDNLLFGKLRPYLSKVYKTQTQGCCSSEFLVMKVINGDIDFYFYRLLSSDFIRIVNSSTYGIKMPRASWDFIKELRVPVPPMDEQRSIKEFISGKSYLINVFSDNKMKLISELEAYKKSLIYEVVTGKKKSSKGDNIPWTTKKNALNKT